MMELLKKDWGINRTIVIGNLVLMGVFDLIIICALFFHWDDLSRTHQTGQIIYQSLMAGGAIGMGLTVLIASAYGGTAFALERHERTADFLAMLPVRRSKIVLSKLILAAACMLAMFVLNFIPILIGSKWVSFRRGVLDLDAAQALLLVLSLSVLLFGVGWLCSSFLESAVISTCISIGATISTWALYWAIGGGLVSARVAIGIPPWCLVSALLGLAALAIGTMHYLHRIEP